jgi:hypothetical protein
MEADEKVLKLMRSRVQLGVDQFVRQRRLTTITGFCVCAVIVVMIGAFIWYGSGIYRDITAANERMLSVSGQQTALSGSYVNLYRSNELKLAAATEKLNISNQLIEEDKAVIALFTQELEATKALLSQTETMLIQANDRNIEITNQLQATRSQGRAISSQQALIAEENIMSIADAQSLMSAYRLKIKSVKNEINRLKGGNLAARAAAISQIDEQKLQIGNNGFIIKDGQTVQVDQSEYNNLKISRPGTWQGNRNVAIDVTFIE